MKLTDAYEHSIVVRLLAKLKADNNVVIDLKDNDRTVGFKIGIRTVIEQIERLTKQED